MGWVLISSDLFFRLSLASVSFETDRSLDGTQKKSRRGQNFCSKWSEIRNQTEEEEEGGSGKRKTLLSATVSLHMERIPCPVLVPHNPHPEAEGGRRARFD